MGKKDALGKDDWIHAGFRALSAGGIAAVKVEPIAAALNVSKGSFYWHFKDVAALHVSMLRHWEGRSTFDVIEELDGLDLVPRQKLAVLIDIATDDTSAEYGGLAAEAALREWARINTAANQTLVRTERIRLAFLSSLLIETGIDAARADNLASILYGGLIGLQALEVNDLANARARLHDLLTMIFD